MAPVGDLEIRPAEARDGDAMRRLLTLLSADAVLRRSDAPAYVAESGGNVIGMVTLCVFVTLTGPKALLDHLVVTPESRRRGVGRALVQHAIDCAQAAGASRIDLTAGHDKRAGRALYRSLGFQERDTRMFRLEL